jgi:ABC-type sulfate/molybdate transport systems ATPase subunit
MKFQGGLGFERRVVTRFLREGLLVTHDPRLAARCDRMIELIDGRIERDEAVAAATPPEPADASTS